MNGHSDDWDYAPFGDDDEIPMLTDIECPFCGGVVEWMDPGFRCVKCDYIWGDADEIERNRREQHDELSDTDSFDRSLRSVGGMLR